MEALILLLIVIVLIVIINLKSDLSSKINALHVHINSLSEQLKKIKSAQEPTEEKKPIPDSVILTHKTSAIRAEEIKPIPEQVKAEPIKEEIDKQPEPTIPQTKPIPTILEQVKSTVNVTPRPPKPGFFERNPDLEKFIGENLANKIGIGILVLGIGFFVKYAIDQNWINEIGRVFIGILCAGALLGVAHALRKKFTAFSSVLVGGGIAVLYLTIAIAFHEYQLFTQTAAFIIMLAITGFAVALSIVYNRIELAILSILGGFASPFMVSTGEGNYIVLFSYILILDVGMLVLAYYKKWNLVTLISYAFTILLFGSWLTARFDGTDLSMIYGAMIFATTFYFVFFMMGIINNVKEKIPFKVIEFSVLLSNSFLFYAAGLVILNNEFGEDYKGLFTALIGVFNFIFAYSLYKNNRADKNLTYLLIGLVLTFISLAAPVQLKGNYITLFWAAETVLLLWLSQKSGIRLMKLASVIIMILMTISLIIDWDQLYANQEIQLSLPILINKAYITGMFAVASIILTLLLLQKEKLELPEFVKLYKGIIILAGIAIFYITQLLELRHQLYLGGATFETSTLIIGCYNMLFLLAILLSEKRLRPDENFKKIFPFIGVFAMLAYLVFYHRHVLASFDDYILSNGSGFGFTFHYALIGILVAIVIFSLPKIRSEINFNAKTYDAYAWFYVFFIIFLASAELDYTVLLLSNVNYESYFHVLSQNHKIGYPILWGLASFILIAVGLKRRKRSLRIISLTLFLITLLKLFLVDIKGVSEGGKIAAFISLGLLLLIVSFMYQRLKKILLSDDSHSPDQSDKKEESV